jgi:DNA-binding protein HU-beta
MAKAKNEKTKEKSMNDFVAELAEKTGLTKAETRKVLDAHAELITSELKSAGSVQLVGMGKFKLNDRAERQGRNPSTGEAITIPAAKVVRFSASKGFKKTFN